MYYRVAILPGSSPTWQWKSTALSSLQSLFQVLRLYGALTQEHLRVFSCPSREGLEEQLRQENSGRGSSPALGESRREVNAVNAWGMSPLEQRREELESGPCGDHDLPHSFSLPRSVPQVPAWMTLLARVQRGELHP